MTTPSTAALRLPWDAVDPFPYYARRRREGDVVWDDAAQAWLVLGYHAAQQVLGTPGWRHDPLASPNAREVRDAIRPELFSQSMLVNDGVAHQRLRGAARDVFTPAFIAGLGPGIEAIADTVFDGIPTGATVDFVTDAAIPLPLAVIGEWLGLDAATSTLLRELAPAVIRMLLPLATADEVTAAAAASVSLVAHFLPLAAERRAHPGEDLLSFIVADPDLLLEEAVMAAVHIAIAGFDTVAGLLGAAAVRLLDPGPDGTRLADVLDMSDPSVITELIRLDGPAQAIPRTATKPTRVGTVEIPADEQVAVVLGAANRDPAVFADPDELRPGRAGPAPLTFGYGPHRCLGVALARLEIEAVLSRLLARDPVLAGPVNWRYTPAVRGPISVPVSFRADGNPSHGKASI